MAGTCFGTSMDISMFYGLWKEAIAVVLDVFGVDGVGGGLDVDVEVLVVDVKGCIAASVVRFVAL
jgi:hypothetical protein